MSVYPRSNCNLKERHHKNLNFFQKFKELIEFPLCYNEIMFARIFFLFSTLICKSVNTTTRERCFLSSLYGVLVVTLRLDVWIVYICVYDQPNFFEWPALSFPYYTCLHSIIWLHHYSSLNAYLLFMHCVYTPRYTVSKWKIFPKDSPWVL